MNNNNNSLDELKTLKPESNKQGGKDSKKKQLKANPLFKELKPIMYYATAVIIIATVGKFTLLDDMTDYHYSNLTVGLNQTEQTKEEIKNSIRTISQLDTEGAQMTELVTTRREELKEANLVRTPLEQSFYFTAYFDSLVKRHNIKLNDMYVQTSRTAEGEELTEEVMALITASSAGVSPIVVEFEGTFENTSKLFNDLYTKRIIYDEDLTITNKYDGTVVVKMVVKFTPTVPVVEGEYQETEDGGL